MLKGKFLSIVTAQNGSRVLQKAMKNTTDTIISRIFDEIKDHIHDLMIDSYGNYFCQKFFSCINDNEKVEFLNNMKDHMAKIGNSKIGTYPLQAILEQLTTREQKQIMIESVRDVALEMCQVNNIFNPRIHKVLM